ncbi:hypothetical protein I6E29_00810 [Arcanobacterium haemolyticum]|nr:hypothetical protein [Arcanobacterium haemolyticum]
MHQPIILTTGLTSAIGDEIQKVLPDVQVEPFFVSGREPPYKQIAVEPVPSSHATAISRYVRLQLTATVMRADHTSDFDEAARIIETSYETLARLPGRIVSCSIDAGPIRLVDDNNLRSAYAVLLLTVTD